MEAIWATIEDFPDYAVSTYGEVKSLRYDKILRQRMNSYGYMRVWLYRNGRGYDLYVHQLVAAAFMSGYVPGAFVSHKDLDRGNNEVSNLRFKRNKGVGQFIRNHPKTRVRRIRVNETGEVFRTAGDIAKALGSSNTSSIYAVLNGHRPKHRGLSFTYVWEDM